MFHRYKIKPHERGLVFKDGDLVAVLTPGIHWYLDLLWKMRLQVVSPRDPWLVHKDLDIIVKSGKLAGEAIVVDLKDSERALVWIDGRMEKVLAPGVYALWTSEHEVRVETIDASTMRLIHPELPAILKTPGTATLLELVNVEPGHAGVWYRDGAYQATLGPGTYAFWKNVGKLKVYDVDLKEQVLDISGQEIMTADKVTLRLNALVAYRITDPLRSVTEVDGASQALYRSAQLALREAVGAKDLDTLLAGKDALAAEVAQALEPRATELGMTVVTAGVRDLILPGDMKDLMNKVTEAKKAAEASLITRREETAAMRMQANTAKILETNPTLMKLKELEVLEKVADKAHLTVLLGEDGLTSKVMKLV
jgi:regulator of protease activity HflC (stomatin/prohibitin superfamily)